VRVYVADAGSSDGTCEYLRAAASDRLVPVLAGRRLGQARAYNEVFSLVESPYVCWLSDDNIVVDRGLDVAVGILDGDAQIGMVALKVKDVAGPFVEAPYIGAVSTIGILNVNQGVLRTPILEEVGGFSEAFRSYGIDPDLTAKVLLRGHSIVYTRGIALHHERGWSPDRTSDAYARQMAKQATYLSLYRAKYGALGRGGLGWRFKRFLWNLAQRLAPVPLALASSRPVLGLIPRDWHNLCQGRYISVLDPWRCRGAPYHLLQRCPAWRRPRVLPRDPEPKGEAAPVADNDT
jgi:GT2 family glycosyltransferase